MWHWKYTVLTVVAFPWNWTQDFGIALISCWFPGLSIIMFYISSQDEIHLPYVISKVNITGWFQSCQNFKSELFLSVPSHSLTLKRLSGKYHRCPLASARVKICIFVIYLQLCMFVCMFTSRQLFGHIHRAAAESQYSELNRAIYVLRISNKFLQTPSCTVDQTTVTEIW